MTCMAMIMPGERKRERDREVFISTPHGYNAKKLGMQLALNLFSFPSLGRNYGNYAAIRQ